MRQFSVPYSIYHKMNETNCVQLIPNSDLSKHNFLVAHVKLAAKVSTPLNQKQGKCRCTEFAPFTRS